MTLAGVTRERRVITDDCARWTATLVMSTERESRKTAAGAPPIMTTFPCFNCHDLVQYQPPRHCSDGRASVALAHTRTLASLLSNASHYSSCITFVHSSCQFVCDGRSVVRGVFGTVNVCHFSLYTTLLAASIALCQAGKWNTVHF